MSDFDRRLRDEVTKITDEADEVMKRTKGDWEAGIRVGFDAAMKALPIDLQALRGDGFVVEGGSYFLGSQLTSLAYSGVNPGAALRHPLLGRLIHEYTDKASKL